MASSQDPRRLPSRTAYDRLVNIAKSEKRLQQLFSFAPTVAASGYIVEINGGCYRTNNVAVLVGSSMFMNVLVSIVRPKSVSGTGQ